MTKPRRGVFWVIDGRLQAYPFFDGVTVGVAKSGNTFNHKKLWRELTISNKPYNYYPRGRVDIRNNGKAVVYLNPRIDTDVVIASVKNEFNLADGREVILDHSDHYKCFLDEGWKADR